MIIPDHIDTYPLAVNFLENGLAERPPTLEAHEASRLRTVALLEAYDNPQDSHPVVHIAGTAGKGSTAYSIDAMLRSAGQETCMRTSPYVHDWREGLIHNGTHLPEDVALAGINKMLPTMRRIQDTYGTLTRFEARNALAYLLFSEVNPVANYSVIEVGIGGAHDSTNVVTRSDKLSVLTTLGLAHQNILGSTVSEIAAQKAGIIVPESAVITAPQEPDAMSAIQQQAAHQRSPLYVARSLEAAGIEPEAITNPLFKMTHYLGNAAVAYAAVQLLAERDNFDFGPAHAIRALNSLTIPGRCERVEAQGKTIFLDIGLWTIKVRATVESLRQIFPEVSFGIVINQSDTPEASSVLESLRTIADTLVAVQYRPDGPRSTNRTIDPERLARMARDKGFSRVEAAADCTEASQLIQSLEPEYWLVTGRPEPLTHIKQALLRR